MQGDERQTSILDGPSNGSSQENYSPINFRDKYLHLGRRSKQPVELKMWAVSRKSPLFIPTKLDTANDTARKSTPIRINLNPMPVRGNSTNFSDSNVLSDKAKLQALLQQKKDAVRGV